VTDLATKNDIPALRTFVDSALRPVDSKIDTQSNPARYMNTEQRAVYLADQLKPSEGLLAAVKFRSCGWVSD
jgi:hypothetical protein